MHEESSPHAAHCLSALQICDFNLSAFLTRDQAGGVAPTNPRWLAPEVLQGGSATAASDVFSFGILLWELLSWRVPWSGMNPFQASHAGRHACWQACVRRHVCAGCHKSACPGCAPDVPAALRPTLHSQIRRAVLDGARPELPRREALPGPGAPALAGLDAYCRLMQSCWAGGPQQRPTLDRVVAQLTALL